MLARERERVCVCVTNNNNKKPVGFLFIRVHKHQRQERRRRRRKRRTHNATNKRPFLMDSQECSTYSTTHTALVFCRQHTKEQSPAFLNPPQVERILLFLKGSLPA
jgi:hypothetical protein